MYPPSTFVSSPAKAASKRRARNKFVNDEAEEAGADKEDYFEDVYERDSFIVDDDEDEGFEPVREGRSRSSKGKGRAELGPPITRDQRMHEARLPDVHQLLVHEFVVEAKQLEEKLRNNRGIKKPLFTDEEFREMAIRWTTTVEEMQKIPGIKTNRVGEYGSRFIEVIRRYRQNFMEMMNQGQNQNQTREVILVESTDDEEAETEDNRDEDEEEDEEGPDTQRSKFFASGIAPPIQTYGEDGWVAAGAISTSKTSKRSSVGSWKGKKKFHKIDQSSTQN
jgi:bloom syndrome protein